MISTPGCIDQLSDLLIYTLTSEQPATEDTICVHGAGCSLLLPIPICAWVRLVMSYNLHCSVREVAKLLHFVDMTKFLKRKKSFL